MQIFNSRTHCRPLIFLVGSTLRRFQPRASTYPNLQCSLDDSWCPRGSPPTPRKSFLPPPPYALPLNLFKPKDPVPVFVDPTK